MYSIKRKITPDPLKWRAIRSISSNNSSDDQRSKTWSMPKVSFGM
jgi:hypothetical protein